MVDHGKRKKFHDKDKYYRLAKEQGLRSRAAFKLSQINRKFGVLEKCQHAVLDLCAAPGGWTQIATKTCASHVVIIAVDLLPIRTLGSNVTTIVGDLTTDKCKSEIKQALAGCLVDVVLHDGAPQVGADYGKDAYQQVELTLHALRCATQHLQPAGCFITKVYRSRDYAALHWVLQQLFGTVTTMKPAASRSQSAEIYVICQDYKAPAKLDPRLLDPKHVFAEVPVDAKMPSVLDSKNKSRRQRGGYDMEHLDATMRHVESMRTFCSSPYKQAIQLLGSSTGLSFTCPECNNNDDDTKCPCQFLLHHPLTTPEIKELASDLQVLGKADFKRLLQWQTAMQHALQEREHDDDNESSKQHDSDEASDSEENEDDIQQEIAQLKQRRARERKRQLKKERALKAKRRKRAALGGDYAIDLPEHDKVFSLATISNPGDLEAARQVHLDQMTDEQIFDHDDDQDVVIGEEEEDDDGELDEKERWRRRERDLEEAYNMYLQTTQDSKAKSGTKMAKRSKKLQREKLANEAVQDMEMAVLSDYHTSKYAQMLQGPKDDSDDSDVSSSEDDEDDGYHAEPMTPEEHTQMQRAKRIKVTEESNPLIHKFADEPASVKTARWFSNPLFAEIDKAAETKADGNDYEDEGNFSVDGSDYSDQDATKQNTKSGLTAEQVLAAMPKSDKQIRHEKRVKAMARDERRKARRAKRLGEDEADFELAPATTEPKQDDVDDLAHLSESKKKKVLEARELIKAGMGRISENDNDSSIEVVSAQATRGVGNRPLPSMDDRKYDSENEDYDSDDYAQTLALGTMVLRRSKEKALVDASYNRYAWNDPSGLPEWFVDDEKKHYRPQLPIPPALVAKMKEKVVALSAKPIKKVAEARARKNKRAKAKLAAAKKQAQATSNSPDMSEAMKLKSISKALRGQDAKRPGKTYVVAKKGRNEKGAKGVKLVDKRMKADQSRKGKKVVGSKRRRR